MPRFYVRTHTANDERPICYLRVCTANVTFCLATKLSNLILLNGVQFCVFAIFPSIANDMDREPSTLYLKREKRAVFFLF